MRLSALLVCRNEEGVVEKCLELLHPFVDEIVFVDMSSTDKTKEIASKFPKVKIYDYPYSEPVDMGKARTFSLSKCTTDYFLQVDADEFYPAESLKKIKEFIENPGEAISLRISYWNVAWREGWVQSQFGHYPDRIYRTDVVQEYFGVLPLDMTRVKPEFTACPNKTKGEIGILEYDNEDDRSFEIEGYPHKNPKQPIRKDIVFYHLARARGFNQEYSKRVKYEKFIHPTHTDEENDRNARWNQWVAANYSIETHDFPPEIPKKIIPNPKVDVIISCYNKGEFIGECIESLLNQTHKPDRILVVDDGSTDNSAEVIRNYPVEYIHQQNQGVAAARNNGLNKITGDYFVMIDGDDRLKETFIEKCLKEMKDDIQICYTDFIGLGEWNGIEYKAQEPDQMRTAQVVPSVMALCDSRIRDNYGNFKDNAVYEDFEFWLNCYYNRKMNFKHIPESLCYYRRTIGSRIDELNKRAEEGYAQLRQWYAEFGVDCKPQ